MRVFRSKHVAVALLAAVLPHAASAQERLAPVYDRSAEPQPAAAQSQPQPSQQPSIESRLERLERILENQALLDLLMKVEGLETQAGGVQSDMEELQHTLDEVKKQQRDLYMDIDRRIREVELKVTQLASAPPPAPAAVGGAPVAVPGAAAPAGSVAPVGGMPSVPGAMPVTAPGGAAPAVAEADPAQERPMYQAAFDLLKAGQYDKAISAFQEFLVLYPDGTYAGNAQYWLGEANYVTRRYDVAVAEFGKVMEQHPESGKLPDALLKLGYTYYELGDWDKARKTLTDVAARYAGATVAKLAERRLQKMRLEGR